MLLLIDYYFIMRRMNMKHRGTGYNRLIFFFSALLILVFLSGCPDPEIIKGPYVQNVSENSMTVCWETAKPCIGKVNFSLSGSMQALPLSVSENLPKTFHEIKLENLETQSLYDYQIFNSTKSSLFDKWVEKPGPGSTFKTAPYYETPFKFTVWGDSQDNPDIFGKLIGHMKGYEPDFAIGCGDLVSDGWILSEWDVKHFTPFKGFRESIPVFSAIGNHEGESPYFKKYFSQPGNELWYSFKYGNSFFIVLDSVIYFPYTPQHLWLLKTLESDDFKNARFKFAFFHYPPYTELWNGHYYDGDSIARDYIAPVLQDAGVDAVFNGHTHAYSRGRSPLEGDPFTYYVVTGGGGGGLDTQAWKDWPEIDVVESQHHFMLVDVNGDDLKISAVNLDGEIIDTFGK